MPATDPLDAVNEAGEKARLPGVGAPGSTPATDQTNLSVASAMERGDRFNGATPPQAPTQRFAPDTTDIMNHAIDSRMAMIAQGQDPDRPARSRWSQAAQRRGLQQMNFLELGHQRNQERLN